MGIDRLVKKYRCGIAAIKRALVDGGCKIRPVVEKTPLTKRQKRQICEQYKSTNMEQLSKEYKIGMVRLRAILVEGGCEIRKGRLGRTKLTLEQETAICREYGDLSMNELSAKYRVGYSRLVQILTAGGVQIRDTNQKTWLNLEQKNEICRKYEHKGLNQLAVEYKTSSAHIRAVLKVRGVRIRGRGEKAGGGSE